MRRFKSFDVPSVTVLSDQKGFRTWIIAQINSHLFLPTMKQKMGKMLQIKNILSSKDFSRNNSESDSASFYFLSFFLSKGDNLWCLHKGCKLLSHQDLWIVFACRWLPTPLVPNNRKRFPSTQPENRTQ